MRQLLKNRITREGVRAYLAPDGEEVHLVFPKGLTGSPFRGSSLMEDIIGKLKEWEGYIVTFTPWIDGCIPKVTKELISSWEEVIL